MWGFTVTSNKKITLVKVNKDGVKQVFSLHSFSSFVKLKCSYKIIYWLIKNNLLRRVKACGQWHFLADKSIKDIFLKTKYKCINISWLNTMLSIFMSNFICNCLIFAEERVFNDPGFCCALFHDWIELAIIT